MATISRPRVALSGTMLISTDNHDIPRIRTHAWISYHEPVHPKIEYDTTNLDAEDIRKTSFAKITRSCAITRAPVRNLKVFAGFKGWMKDPEGTQE